MCDIDMVAHTDSHSLKFPNEVISKNIYPLIKP